MNEQIAFECNICKAEFKKQKSLNEHIDFSHEGKSSFTCSVCNARFPRKGSLTLFDVG